MANDAVPVGGEGIAAGAAAVVRDPLKVLTSRRKAAGKGRGEMAAKKKGNAKAKVKPAKMTGRRASSKGKASTSRSPGKK